MPKNPSSNAASAALIAFSLVACGGRGGPSGSNAGVAPPPSGTPLPDEFVLARGERNPGGLTSDATQVFWGTSISENCCAEVRSAPKTGGAPATAFAAPRQLDVPGHVNHLAAVSSLYVDAAWIFARVFEREAVPSPGNDSQIYWADTLWRVSRADGRADRFPPAGFPPAGSLDIDFSGPGSFSAADENLYFLKQPALAKADRDFFIAAVAKASGVVTVAKFHPQDPLFNSIEGWVIDGDTLFVSYGNYWGAAHLYCLARAPRTGGNLEDLWCPDFPARQLTLGTDHLFAFYGFTTPNFWMVEKQTGSARGIANGRADAAIAGVDEKTGVLFGLEASLGSQASPAWSELFQVEITTGKRGVVDRAVGLTPSVDPGPPRHSLSFDRDRLFFVRDNEVYSRKR